MPEADKIVIRGAREHNLKNINIELPRGKFIVVTGISGSGKSSLAFDTLYAEGQRRYVESLSAYARQFLEQMKKPDVDSIEGLSPAIAIEQKTASKNPRSTVGTVTEIHDYLRLLFARVGVPHCIKCGREISAQTVQQMVDRLLSLPEGSLVTLLAPVVKGRKGEYVRELERLRKDGYAKVLIDGEYLSLDDEIKLEKNKKHNIDVVVDRIKIKSSSASRAADSLETALSLGGGVCRVVVEGGEEFLFNERYSCPFCNIDMPELEPRLFSFNSPSGACPECTGLGFKRFFDPDLIVPNPELSIREGAIAPFQRRHQQSYIQMMDRLAEHYGFDIYTPYKDLPERIKRILLYGSGNEVIKFFYEVGDRRHFYTKPFEGVIPYLERRYREVDSDFLREEIERYMGFVPCPSCKGTRLKPEALAVTVGDKNIAEISAMSIFDAVDFFGSLQLEGAKAEIAGRILKEIRERLDFLKDVGLGYLTLDRASHTLSGGESQRIRLATQIGSGLTGVLYILDEPSIGLHQRDNEKLLATLMKLRDLGNTLVVVEHDERTIRAADYVVDMGPGAGIHGGEVVAQGMPSDIEKEPGSITGRYLSGVESIPVPRARRKRGSAKLELIGCREHNLRNIDVEIPLGMFVCVTGVSGSGKSTLVIDTLYRALRQRLLGARERAGEFKEIRGIEYVDKVINIDQSPIGRTPRSNPATYTGLFTPIRELFSRTRDARARGYKPGRFSFNVKGGRCEACQGDGVIRIEMHFLPDVYVPCDVCRGRRYNRETLEIRYRGLNIADVLDLTVNQAFEVFSSVPVVVDKLQTLKDVGLGYIKLGQQATTLSGGEAQRIKLSRELSKRATGRTVYILDEPTTGLHFDDIKKLLEVLRRLVGAGNTVVVIEHNLDVIKCADHIIDLGPEGGDFGGDIVASGTPEEVARDPASHTGAYLRPVLGID